MKRKPTSSQDTHPQQSSRQEPLSCQNCRSRKIKCDRQQPCFNCSTRALTCFYANRSNHHQNDEPGSRSTRYRGPTITAAQHVQSPTTVDSEELTMADWLEKIVMSPRIPDILPSSLKGRFIVVQRDCQGPGMDMVSLIARLPPRTEALRLLRYYMDFINYLYHITVPSRAEGQISHIYECIDSGAAVDMSRVALLFSIIAVALHFQQPSSAPPEGIEKQCQAYAFLAGASLIQANYVAYPTIEGLQATIIIAHHVSNINIHLSVRGLFVLEAMIGQARSLALHCTDLPCRKEEFDLVLVEIKRRLWWHLSAYDWFLSFLSGPQERTYTIHPNHMNVKRPSNLNDNELDKQNEQTNLYSH